MNSFDPFLKFTEVVMTDNKITYLDTKIIEKDDSLELEQHRKTSIYSTCMMNYKQAVAPLQYKNSCLNGKIYRAKNCTSNETTLNLALQDLEVVFLINQYPNKLIRSKINEIKSRNFAPNPNKAIREEDQKNQDIKFFLFFPALYEFSL
jgi:hypothetical protein